MEIIDGLLEKNQRLSAEAQQMRDEIAVLKGEKAKPKFKSSKMDKNTNKDKNEASGEDGEKLKRPGSAKRSKTAQLQIHEERVVAPANPIPADSRFKGYRDVVVQGLVIKAHNIRSGSPLNRSEHFFPGSIRYISAKAGRLHLIFGVLEALLVILAANFRSFSLKSFNSG